MILTLGIACHHEVNLDPARGAAPTATELFEANVEALGGERALLAHWNELKLARMSLPGGLVVAVTSIAVAPNQVWEDLDLGRLGKAEVGFDGTVGWSSDQMMGPRLLEGDELAAKIEAADFYAELHWRDTHIEPRVEGTVEVDGVLAWKVAANDPRGHPTSSYHRSSDGLIIQVDRVEPTPGGPMPLSSRYSDFQEVDGVLVAHHQRLITGPQEVAFDVLSVDFNVGGVKIAPPPEVVELLAGTPAP